MHISEIFYSIQGEGLLTGMPSVFVRLAGCVLQCRWCDTPHSQRPEQGRDLPLEAVLAAVASAGGPVCRHAVVTGGEPLLADDLPALTRGLSTGGLHVTIETAAIHPPPGGLHCDLASLSPKLSDSTPGPEASPARRLSHEALRLQPAAIDAWMARFNYQLKFVVRHSGDLAEILELLDRLDRRPPPGQVLLMPEGVTPAALAQHAPVALEACRRHGFRYCDRLHIRLFGHQQGV